MEYNSVYDVLADARTRAQAFLACGVQGEDFSAKDTEWLEKIDHFIATYPKPELCEFLHREAMPAVFLLNALSEHAQNSPEFNAIFASYQRTKNEGNPNKQKIEVILLVGGIQVPFWKTMMEVWTQTNRMIEERAAEKALEMITAAGLKPIENLMQDIEEMVRARFYSVGIELPREE